MNNKIKLVVTIVVLALVVVGSKLLYDNYADTSAKLVTSSGEVVSGTDKTEKGHVVKEIDLASYNTAKEADASAQEAQQDAPPEDIIAPNITFYDADGNQVLFNDFIGKPTVLNFWASWCGPCKIEMPFFESVYTEMGEDVNFIMLNATDGAQETKESAIKFVEEEGYTMPVYYDIDQNGGSTYGIVSLPTTIFISKDGYIAAGVQGSIDEETLRKGIELATNHQPTGETAE